MIISGMSHIATKMATLVRPGPVRSRAIWSRNGLSLTT